MTRRFASHFLLLPGLGYLKQYIIEVSDGYAASLFPLTEEMEDVEWFPGVIALLPEQETAFGEYADIFLKSYPVLQELPQDFCRELASAGLMACLFFPFDFTSMQPAAGTRHRLLR